MSTFEFDDSTHVERLRGTLHAPGATTGDVLTVNADKSISPAAGGGSQPIVPVTFPFAWNTPGITATGFPITGINQGTQTITVGGDQTASFPAGTHFGVSGSTGNDGVYTVVSATLNAGSTDIVTVEALPDATANGNANATAVAGALVYTPAIGDLLLVLGEIEITTGFDGSTPRVSVLSQGDNFNNDDLMENSNAGNPDGPLGNGTHFVVGSTQSATVRALDTNPVVVLIHDGNGGDPGNGAGDGVVRLFVVPAS